MQTLRSGLLCIMLFVASSLLGQDRQVIQNYINTYRDVAVAEMQRTGVPASITLSQGIHETLAGTSDLVLKSNNHFGIKCKSTWTGESVSHDDDLRGECFRKYASPLDSYKDHSDFLKGNQRYAFLFNLDPLDYTSWAWGLKKAGYATNPKYPQIIIKLIEDYGLQDYTLIALGREPENKELLAGITEKAEKEPLPAAGEISQAAAPDIVNAVLPEPTYPHDEFRINNTRVVFARKGTSFLSLAQQHNISLSRLFEFNDMEEKEAATEDRLVFLQRKRKTGSTEFHIVQPGESLYDIAQREGIRMDMLLEYNHLQEFMKPAAGAQLCLTRKAAARPALAIDPPANGNRALFASNSSNTPPEPSAKRNLTMHTVQKKETVYSIAKKYNVKIDDLVAWNHLSSYSLNTGQQLKIYK